MYATSRGQYGANFKLKTYRLLFDSLLDSFRGKEDVGGPAGL